MRVVCCEVSQVHDSHARATAQELMPKSKGKVEAAVKQRGKLGTKLAACMQ